MTLRTAFQAVALAVLTASGTLLAEPEPKAGKTPEAFDLAGRKQKQSWLWEAPVRQQAPTVRDVRWPRVPEDRFILSRLEAAGLKPAPDTDARTWLRRVHFVITGLPPSPQQIRAFLEDKSPGSRERVVDGLLATPQFGERWARHWMDLMRYAESRGHEGDYIIANAWQYRDYLIRALNADVPYNQFLMEHLAGDLMPEPRLRPGTDINESVVATGWAFLGEENHSPVDIRQDECERVDNKVDVFSKTFLGLTISCARCHDHKFDPIRAQDYYALSGFMLGSSFRQVRFEAMENNRRMASELRTLRARWMPKLAATVAASRQAGVERLADTLMSSQKRLASPDAAGGPEAAAPSPWVDHLRQAATNASSPLHGFASVAIPSAAEDTVRLEGLRKAARPPASPVLPEGAVTLADFTRAGRQPWKTDGEAFGTRPMAAGELILGSDATNPVVRVMAYGAACRDLFWNRLKAAPGNENDSGRLGATHRAGQMLRTPTFTLGAGKLHYLIRGRARVYAAVDSHIMLEGPLHGVLTQTLGDAKSEQPRWVTHDLTAYIGHRAHVEFGPEGDAELQVLMVVESATQPSWVPGTGVFSPSTAATTLAAYAAELQAAATAAWRAFGNGTLAGGDDAGAKAALVNWILQHPDLFPAEADPEATRTIGSYLKEQQDLATRVKWESRTAVSWFDGTGVDEHVLVRGKPFKPGVLSPRSLPAAFSSSKPVTTTASSGRMELAEQLIDPANPLVARTLVNRVWHHVFGRGIVATVDNFGSLGERPTHPELLDHLAWQFIHEDGWSVKRLIRRMVLMRAFSMDSRESDPRAAEIDPSNQLLHRMTVRRLEGEVIRDSLLAVSGRLNPSVGGPPVMVHLTEFLVGRGRPDAGGPLDGDGRRSIYTAMRRNFLPTLMQTFDAPTPFSTVGRRNVTNVPAQSLALMNDALFHQQARVWAERSLREDATAEPAARIRTLFETAYGRLPTAGETGACLETLGELRDLHPSSTAQGIEAWSDLCHALLNANDFIYVK